MTNLDKQRDELANINATHDTSCTCKGTHFSKDKYESFSDGFSACEKILSERIEKLEAALKYFKDAQCDCSVAERLSGHLVGCWKPEADEKLKEALGSGE